MNNEHSLAFIHRWGLSVRTLARRVAVGAWILHCLGGTPGVVCSNTPFHGPLPPFEGWLHRVGATARTKFLVERRRPILLLLPVRMFVRNRFFVALATLCRLLGRRYGAVSS